MLETLDRPKIEIPQIVGMTAAMRQLLIDRPYLLEAINRYDELEQENIAQSFKDPRMVENLSVPEERLTMIMNGIDASRGPRKAMSAGA